MEAGEALRVKPYLGSFWTTPDRLETRPFQIQQCVVFGAETDSERM